MSISCRAFPTCSGCQFQKNVISPPIGAEIKEFFLSIGVQFSLHHGKITEWRTRAKLAVRGSPSSPQIGLFKKHSHDVVPILDCPLHHSTINEALCFIEKKMVELMIEPYNETKGTGLLRYLQLVVERKTNKVQLTLVINARKIEPQLQSLLDAFEKEPIWHSIWVNFQPLATNRIFGEEWVLCQGERTLWETFGTTSVCFHPACFAQAHLSLFESVLVSIQTHILAQKKVVEYYAGVGVIGLSVAEKCSELTCCEIAPFSKECFEHSREKLSPTLRKKVHFHLGDVKNSLHFLDTAEVVIVDPPRKGLDFQFLEALSHSKAEQLIYLSCEWRSFKRDCEKLIEAGWKVERAEGYLLFPGTDQIEVLAFFQKI